MTIDELRTAAEKARRDLTVCEQRYQRDPLSVWRRSEVQSARREVARLERMLAELEQEEGGDR